MRKIWKAMPLLGLLTPIVAVPLIVTNAPEWLIETTLNIFSSIKTWKISTWCWRQFFVTPDLSV